MFFCSSALSSPCLFLSRADGIAYAAVFSLTTSALPEFGRSKLGIRSNFNLMLLFLAGSLGSLASGFLRSNVGSYKWPFAMNAASFAIAAIAGMVKYFVYDARATTKVLSMAAGPTEKVRLSYDCADLECLVLLVRVLVENVSECFLLY